jgi:hypothetical protein
LRRLEETMSDLTREYDLPIYSRRWNTLEKFHAKRTKAGWEFRFQSGPVATEPNGLVDHDIESGIHRLLEAEGLSYPADLSDHLEWV